MKIFAIFSQFSTRPPQGSTRRVEIVCGYSILYVIPNQAKGFTRHPEAAHEPRGISPFVVTHSLRWDSSCSRGAPPLTSPHWGSCAASSKCSCKQVFLLASDGMTESSPCYNHAARKVAPFSRLPCNIPQKFKNFCGTFARGASIEDKRLPCVKGAVTK